MEMTTTFILLLGVIFCITFTLTVGIGVLFMAWLDRRKLTVTPEEAEQLERDLLRFILSQHYGNDYEGKIITTEYARLH